MVMHTELQATCSALGYHEGRQYVKEPDCLETVKELIRFLRREDDTCDIRRQLGHAQILQKDLIPLVKHYHADKPLFDTVIRLLVNLTQPVIVCFNNQLPEEKTLRQYCLEIESHLQQYKEAFVDEELFTVLTKKMTDILNLDWEHRHEEDRLMLERLLVLVRNVVLIPPDPDTEQRTDDDASLHDQVLWAIHVSGMEDLLLYIASSDNERQLCMHILEIISLMFREQSPEVLAFAGVQRSVSEKEKDERELEMARNKEKEQRRNTLLKFSARHSNFGGTFVMMNTKSLSDRELIYHKPVQDADSFTLDVNKKRRKRPKNRQPIKDQPIVRRSTLSIRIGLKEFCVQFLENAYNPLMRAVKDNLQREATQDLDETYYFWSMQFFMEFCRHHSGHVDFISETMSVATFHYIYNNLLRYYEMIMVEKKEAIAWGRRVHLALRAYQELLMTLDMMDKSNNSHLIDSSRVIKSNVFYMMEFRDIFITLLKRFNESKNSRTYLKDLVESTHLFLRMLEKFTKGNNHLVVQGKKRRKRKQTKKTPTRQTNLEPTEQELEDLWQEISSDLSAVLQGREEIPQDVTPFDAASEVDIEQQRVDAMVRIQTSLRQKRPAEAVALFRAAREVWPDQDQFGSQDIATEEEFMALRQVFMAALPRAPDTSQPQTLEIEVEEEEGENEEKEATARVDWEQEFNFIEYLQGYAKPEILKAYVLLAADFVTNSAHTNHCLVKMLHRIGFDMGFVAMLFQASLFRVFQKLLLGPHAKSPRFQEFSKFAVHVVRKFSEVAEKNKNVFMESLFWKSSKESMQITEGYDYNPSNVKVAWTEDEENELLRLFEDFRDAANPEKDAIDLIMERWTGSSKTRGQIIRHLRCLRLIESAKDLKRKPGASSARIWTAEDENELRQLFEENKDAKDPLGSTVAALSKKRSKNKVKEKLLALGLVDDHKQLFKKRGKKSDGGKKKRRSSASDSQNSGSDSEGAVKEDHLPSDEEILSSPSASDMESDSAEENLGVQDGKLEAVVSVGFSDVIKNIVEKGYKDQVSWIQRRIALTASSREGQDKIFPAPIVPLTEENETAMEDPLFVEFLQRLGFTPPSTEQEAFWRIPANLTAIRLKTLGQGIELDADGNLIHPDILDSLQQFTPPATARKKKHKAKKNKQADDQQKKEQRKQKNKKTREIFGGKKVEKNGKKKRRKREKEAIDSDNDRDSIVESDNDRDSIVESDNDNDRQQSVSGGEDNAEEMGPSKGSKMPTAAQRREALKAMLARRKGKQRDDSHVPSGSVAEPSEEQPVEEADTSQTSPHHGTDMAIIGNNQAAKKRLRKFAESDSDDSEDDSRLMIDSDAASLSSSPAKPAKRLRLLDSDDEESNGSGSHNSDDENRSQSQPQSQGLLDFGDSDDDADGDRDGTRPSNGNEDSKGQAVAGLSLELPDHSKESNPSPSKIKPSDASESFPATMFSQGPPISDDSDIDDHITLAAAANKRKKRILIDDDDDESLGIMASKEAIPSEDDDHMTLAAAAGKKRTVLTDDDHDDDSLGLMDNRETVTSEDDDHMTSAASKNKRTLLSDDEDD